MACEIWPKKSPGRFRFACPCQTACIGVLNQVWTLWALRMAPQERERVWDRHGELERELEKESSLACLLPPGRYLEEDCVSYMGGDGSTVKARTLRGTLLEKLPRDLGSRLFEHLMEAEANVFGWPVSSPVQLPFAKTATRAGSRSRRQPLEQAVSAR